MITSYTHTFLFPFTEQARNSLHSLQFYPQETIYGKESHACFYFQGFNRGISSAWYFWLKTGVACETDDMNTALAVLRSLYE